MLHYIAAAPPPQSGQRTELLGSGRSKGAAAASTTPQLLKVCEEGGRDCKDRKSTLMVRYAQQSLRELDFTCMSSRATL